MFSTTPRRLRTALATLAVATLGLSACTQDPATPQITDAPDLTTGTVRLASLGGDRDAELVATATATALQAGGISVKRVQAASGHGWDADNALAALKSGELDMVVGGGSVLAAEGTTASGLGGREAAASGDVTQSGGSDGAGATATTSAAPTPPSDQAAALAAVTNELPEGTAVAGTALRDRQPVLVIDQALSEAEKMTTVAQAMTACKDLTVAVPRDWATAWGAGWLERVGCDAKAQHQVAGTVEVGEDIMRGTVGLGLARSSDPEIADLGLVRLDDQQHVLGADPVLTLVRTEAVGQDALDLVGKLGSAAQGDDWSTLRRVADPVGGDDEGPLVARWLVEREVVGGGADGLPTTKAPASASSKG